MNKTMTFDAIEKKLADHCDTTKCVRERVEMHKAAKDLMETGPKPTGIEPLVRPWLPVTQAKR